MASQYLARMKLLHKVFRIILNHPDLFEHHLFFLFHFFGVELGVMEKVGQQFERLVQLLIENFDVKCRRLTRGEGVHFTAKPVNFARNFDGRPRTRAFEKHVLNEMGVSGL